MKAETVSLEIPSASAYIAVARNVIDSLRIKIRLSPIEVDDLKLAVGEACSNAVKFSAPPGSGMRVLYLLRPDRIEVEVRNRGECFPRAKRRPCKPAVGDLTEGQLGIYLISRVMDELLVRSKGGYTTLRMVKMLSRA